MDKFLTFDGEQPIWLDDFNFMYDSVKDAITQVVHAITRSDEPTCILYGCELTYEGNTMSWTDGIVMLSGEILPVKAGTINNGGNQDLPLYFNVVETYEPEGERLFKNGERHNCYQKRHVTISDDDNDYYIYEISRLEDLLHEEEHLLYSNNETGDPTYGTRVIMLHPFGGGYYLNGIFKVVPVMGIKRKNIIPKTDITNVINEGIESGTTLGTMTYVNAAGTTASVYPIIIKFTIEENRFYMQADFAQEISLSMGEGQFYCRIIGSGRYI